MPIVVSHDVHKNFTDGVFAIKQDARKKRMVTNLWLRDPKPSLQGPWMALQA